MCVRCSETAARFWVWKHALWRWRLRARFSSESGPALTFLSHFGTSWQPATIECFLELRAELQENCRAGSGESPNVMTDDTLWRYVHMYSIGFCWCFNWTSNSAKQMFDSYLLRTFEKMVSKLFRNWKVRVVPFACRFSIGLVAKRASGGGESAGEAEKGEDAEVCVVS